jgi:hypothetical protein
MTTMSTQGATLSSTHDLIQDLVLPRDLPSQDQNRIFTITSSAEDIKWGFHEGSESNFFPLMFWT